MIRVIQFNFVYIIILRYFLFLITFSVSRDKLKVKVFCGCGCRNEVRSTNIITIKYYYKGIKIFDLNGKVVEKKNSRKRKKNFFKFFKM